MKFELDISKCSKRFLRELVGLLESPETLNEIVNYAVNVDDYDDYEGCLDEEDCYLDDVVLNPNTPLEAIISIIEYPTATYARWKIIETIKLEDVLLESFAKFENDFSLICMIMEKYSLTTELADVIAERLSNDKIKVTDVVNDDYDCTRAETFNQNIEFIIHKCSDELKQKLRKWLSENSWLDKKFKDMPMAKRTDLQQNNRTCFFHHD